MGYILSIDVGTQSLKAYILDDQLRIKEQIKVEYSMMIQDKYKIEMDTEGFWNAFKEACGNLKNVKKIDAISFATLCPSLVILDDEGMPLRPMILHLDRRSYKQAVWALKRVPEETFLAIAGNPPIPGGISLTSLLWVKENEPSLYERKNVTFGHAITFFTKRLVGECFIDPSNASFTGLYETVEYGDWSDILLKELGIHRDKLPTVVKSATVVGKLLQSAARESGLPEGIPVVIGANDTTCASVGAGILKTGELLNTSGTVEIMVLSLTKPLLNKKHLLRTHAYDGHWLAMRVVGAGGASVEWFRENFCKEMTKDAFYNAYLPKVLLNNRNPDAQFHPFLSGDRHCIKSKLASFTRLSLSSSRDDLLSALANGIVKTQIEGIKEWEKNVELADTIYHVGGGATQSYTDFKRNLLKKYNFVEVANATALGAAKICIDAMS